MIKLAAAVLTHIKIGGTVRFELNMRIPSWLTTPRNIGNNFLVEFEAKQSTMFFTKSKPKQI
jgi:hypothetical protein